MNVRYVLGIIITVILLSVNQIFIQYWLAQKKNDAQTINIAGKQRMLSQRINTEFYRIQQEGRSTDSLQQLFQQWKEAHFYLQAESTPEGGAPINSPAIRSTLQALDINIDFIETQLGRSEYATVNLKQITQNQSDFLSQMDVIVKNLETDSDSKLRFIIRIEYVLFFLSLIILIWEVFYIYVPVERSLRSANEEIREKNQQLEHAVANVQKKNQELEQITYITSHDLQEPIRTINSLVNLFRQKYASSFDESGKKMLGFMDTATLRLRDLIKGLLDYSVLGKKKQKTPIDCQEMLEEIRSDLALQIETAKAQVSWEALPTIVGNRAEIRLLFQNLISNALKFQASGKQAQVKIEATEKERFWVFSVSDNGIGIEAEHLEKIFSIFHRVHSKDDYEGTGIGLAHCAKIVDIHGGKIWVESKVNEGSTFFFTIKRPVLEINEYEKEAKFHSVG